MSIATRIDTFLKKRRLAKVTKEWQTLSPDFAQELSLRESLAKYENPNEAYRYFHQYFHHRCPQIIRDHRKYFSIENRGFGEEAMHAMWWLLFLEHKPIFCLEIGVYRGQVVSLWRLISNHINYSCDVYGISPFSNAADEVSHYASGINYYDDVLKNFNYFQLPLPNLVKNFSTDSLALETIASRQWDLIYIDGSHDYEVVLNDYYNCKKYLKKGGLLIFDDSALYLDYEPPLFAFKGHIGPSKVVKEFVMNEMKFLGSVGHNLIFETY